MWRATAPSKQDAVGANGAGGGFTFAPGVRLGASATRGPYLGRDLPTPALAGRSWRAYRQRVGDMDGRFSRGQLDLRGELAASSYDVPDAAGALARVDGITCYGEAKYTLTPRLFVAARAERNDYPHIVPRPEDWQASATDLYDAEVGAGRRFGAATTLNVSVRVGRWQVPPALQVLLPNGLALALQFSRSFDLRDRALGPRRAARRTFAPPPPGAVCGGARQRRRP